MENVAIKKTLRRAMRKMELKADNAFFSNKFDACQSYNDAARMVSEILKTM